MSIEEKKIQQHQLIRRVITTTLDHEPDDLLHDHDHNDSQFFYDYAQFTTHIHTFALQVQVKNITFHV